MNTLSPHHQTGFSLIEMTIVMVLIGLLVGGIMQGSSLIRAAKVNDTLTTIADLQSMSQAFKQRFHALPGDHPTASNEIQGVTNNGDGDGDISASEAANASSHLYAAGFLRSNENPITSAYGPVWIVAQSIANSNTSPCGTAVNNSAPVFPNRNAIVLNNLSGDAAQEIDLKLDDGDYNSGKVRGSSAYSNDMINCVAVPL